MKGIQRRKKHSYLLLELLIAFFILSLFLAPLLDSPLSYLKKQKKELLSIYLSLEGEKQLFYIEEKLRNQTIPWKLIEQSQTREVLIETRSVELSNIRYEVELFLAKGSLQSHKEGISGKVRGIVKLYKKNLKGPKVHQTQGIFFLFKKQKSNQKESAK